MNIGYATAKADLGHPAFRRRFGYYLKSREKKWEVADIRKSYDLVIVHHSADLPAWQSYGRGKVIFDYNDDYLGVDMGSPKARLRGSAKYLSGQWSKWYLDFKDGYIAMMRRADAIVCCTQKQFEDATRYCKNIVTIPDMQSDGGWSPKADYTRGGAINLVWEGLPSFEGIAKISRVLKDVHAETGSAFHVITKLRAPRVLSTLFPASTEGRLRILGLPRTYMYEWNEFLFPKVVCACDLAVIPIDMDDPFWVGKPANKLLFFWRLGMPTLASATPEYLHATSQCGLSDMICHNAEEWREKLMLYGGDTDLRRQAGERARHFMDKHYSNEVLLAAWDRVIEQVLSTAGRG